MNNFIQKFLKEKREQPLPNVKRATLYLILIIITATLIFIFSHLPGESSSSQSGRLLRLLSWLGVKIDSGNQDFIHYLIRKLAHITEYFLLSFFVYRYRYHKGYKNIVIPTLVFSVLYACSDEFHQYFIPNRGPSFVDVLIDSIGITIATTLNYIIYKFR